MVDSVVTKQELIDAQKDAQSLEDVINGPADTRVKPRIGPEMWTLATINSLVQQGQIKISDLSEAIQIALAAGAGSAGWTANLVADGNQTQKEINLYGGKKYDMPVGGYPINAVVRLENGDIVKSTEPNNTIDPNVDMTGWISIRSIYQVNTIAELLAIQNPEVSDICDVSDDLRGGKFYFDPSRALENNGGTVFNGWVRKYFGSVYLEWFCETDPKTTDCSVYMERALTASKSVKAGSREFLFSGQVGIPDTGQHIYAWSVAKITGDGDTVFKIDCLTTGRATFTSSRAKLDPTSLDNIYVGKVEFKGINFRGVNTTGGFELTEANKNTVDRVFDGDRLYNTHAHECNFVHLRNALTCTQRRGANIEGNNAYSQSFSITNSHFFHCYRIVESEQVIAFRFHHNKCEQNYGGIYLNSNIGTAAAVFSINDNVFEAGGKFLHCVSGATAGSIQGNYFEHNILEDVLTDLCQIQINGNTNGLLIASNSFSWQIAFDGYDTDYMDIKLNDLPYNEVTRTDLQKSKPVLLANYSSSRQLNSPSRVISISNSQPIFANNGWVSDTVTRNKPYSLNLTSPMESDVSFSRGQFSKPIPYTQNAIDGTSVSTLDSSNRLMIGILDLNFLSSGIAKNKMSIITGQVCANVDFMHNDVAVSNASVIIHVSICARGYGADLSIQYSDLRVQGNLLSILQPYDVPVINTQPTSLMKKQFSDDTKVSIQSVGGGRFALRLSGYIGAPNLYYGGVDRVVSSLTWQGSVGCRANQDQVGSAVYFHNTWWG